jgi:hypothetical protein
VMIRAQREGEPELQRHDHLTYQRNVHVLPPFRD